MTFKDLEPDICDLAIQARIAADIGNNVSMQTTGDGDFIISKADMEAIVFCLTQIDNRASELRGQFYKTIREGADADAS